MSARHLCWNDVAQDQPVALRARRRIIGEKAMISQVSLQQGCRVATHAHENEQFVCVLSGEVRFGVGDEGSADRYSVTVKAGEVLHLPSHAPHSADAVVDSLVLDVFSPPSATTGIDVKR